MSIQEIVTNIKRILGDVDTFLALLLILTAVSAFGLGRLSVAQNTPQNKEIKMTEMPASALVAESNGQETVKVSESPTTTPKTPEQSTQQVIPQKEQYVASKNGTKYHLPWCPGAKQIKEENKIWFSSKEEAEKAGYTPASNCKGL